MLIIIESYAAGGRPLSAPFWWFGGGGGQEGRKRFRGAENRLNYEPLSDSVRGKPAAAGELPDVSRTVSSGAPGKRTGRGGEKKDRGT